MIRGNRTQRPSLATCFICVICLVLSIWLVGSATAIGQQERTTDLPWNKRPGDDNSLTFRELLDPIGFDDEYWQGFRHGDTLDSESMLQGLRLLDRLSAFTPRQWGDWREPLPTGKPLMPADRGRVYDVEGFVTSVVGPFLLADQGLQGFRVESYFIADVKPSDPQLASQDPRCRIVCQHVPQAWLKSKRLQEPCRLDGVFLVSAKSGPSWFAADRIRWYADEAGAQRIKVPRAWQFLGRHDVDIGRVEALQRRNQQTLNGGERQVFYPILSLLDDFPDDWEEVPSTPWSLTDLLRAPQDYQGQRLKGRVTARRVTKVLVDDPAITERLGIDSYYQVDVFFPLKGAKIRLTAPDAKTNEDAPVYTNGYPGTVVCLTLPSKLGNAAKKVLDGTAKTQLIQVPLEIDGIFLKIWSYRSKFLNRGDTDRSHPSPLIIAAQLEVVDPPETGKSSLFSTLIVVGFICLFCGALALGWWANQGRRATGR